MVELSKAGIRIADDDIYLNEDRYRDPKEMFKFINLILPRDKVNKGIRWLDVGCATGEFIYYLKSEFPRDCFTGVDISPAMITKAAECNPKQRFLCEDLLNQQIEVTEQYDIVTCTGVLQIFDQIEKPINNLLSLVAAGGILVITGSFNNHDVDVLMRYRRTNEAAIWETGWNLFSKATYEGCLENNKKVAEWTWHDFTIPISLSEKDDPMRSWTIKTEFNPNQLINGAGQLLYVKSCLIYVV